VTANADGLGATLLTVGHGQLGEADLAALLAGAGVTSLVDVRRFPGSRAHPHVAREALAGWLPGVGVAYRWEPRLGGRRRLPTGDDAADVWWQVPAFRAYAAHTRGVEFTAALSEVLGEAARRRVAVLCSETLWWRCHRRLVADVAVLAHGVEVLHLMPGGRLSPHRPAAGARLLPGGQVLWDGAATAATPGDDDC
jgi:uncharacterized protein (DUF488 family)